MFNCRDNFNILVYSGTFHRDAEIQIQTYSTEYTLHQRPNPCNRSAMVSPRIIWCVNQKFYTKQEDELEECIAYVDSDGSGSVDFAEFLELMKMKTKEHQEEAEVREAFRVLDRGNKGNAYWK